MASLSQPQRHASSPTLTLCGALELNAVAIILFHNHPSGNPEPSQADRQVTERLKQALSLLDHLVIGGRQHVSLASKGWA